MGETCDVTVSNQWELYILPECQKDLFFFPVGQGVVQCCTLSCTLFLIYIVGLLHELENWTQLRIVLRKNKLQSASI